MTSTTTRWSWPRCTPCGVVPVHRRRPDGAAPSPEQADPAHLASSGLGGKPQGPLAFVLLGTPEVCRRAGDRLATSVAEDCGLA
ncbi:hypothetical protein ACWDBO_18595 [Streptomyces mirabilis]|uniref:hypothetical protein n=1 Tax=Streptomyces TaxID=1883 RepID=UPI0029A71CD8|nr:hypothetical protein [Streptomyces sp. AK02-04a]MDX3759962.1 hypothetical protein [Streptomyces sp. AK02-04a]